LSAALVCPKVGESRRVNFDPTVEAEKKTKFALVISSSKEVTFYDNRKTIESK
jgi:hypothetical protein